MASRRLLRRFVQCLVVVVLASAWIGRAQTQPTPPVWNLVNGEPTAAYGNAIVLPNGMVWNDGASHWDPAQRRWFFHWLRQSPAAALLQDGRILLAGGSDASGIVRNSVDLLTLDAGQSSSASVQPMSTPRIYASAVTLLDGRVLVAGGFAQQPQYFFVPLDTAEVYNPATDTWSPTGQSTVPPEAGGSIVSPQVVELLDDGRVLLVRNNGAEIFDPVTNMWSATAPLPVNGSWGVSAFWPSVRLQDGRVMIVGGSFPQQTTNESRALVYDPIADEWSATPIGIASHRDAYAVLRDDGRVLVAGTHPQFSPPQAFLFDPVANAWSPVPLPATFMDPISLLAQLPNGTTLVAAGAAGTYILGRDTVPPPPIANAGPDLTVTGCVGCLSLVTLDASGSTDPEEQQKDYIWTRGTTTLATTFHPASTTVVQLPLGIHAIELTLTDWNGGASTDTVVITVVDPTADLTSQLAQCQANVSAITAQITTLQAEVATLQGELAAANTLNAQLTAQITALQAEIQTLNATIAGLTAQVAALQADLAGAANTITALDTQIAALTTQVGDLTALNAALAAQVAPLQASVNQLVAPASQVATAIVDVNAMIPNAPTNMAKSRLESARASLVSAGINVAAVDFLDGLNKIRNAVSLLQSAPLATMNTAPIRESLSLGIRTRVERALADVTPLAGSSQTNVVAAAGHLTGGDADHAAGNYLAAIDKYILAFKQLAQI